MHVVVRKIKYRSTIPKKVIWPRAVLVLTVARVYEFRYEPVKKLEF